MDVPEITIDSNSDEMSDEYESFYEQCDRLYNRVAKYPSPPQEYKCKKDSRYWLYKNRTKAERPTREWELTYDEVFSVIARNGRRYKKDSRVWLHKSSERAMKIKQMEQRSKMKQFGKNSNCRTTESFHDDSGIDENSLTAMSKIAICGPVDPNDCSKRSHDSEVQENVYSSRNRKRRKMGNSLPCSPAQFTDSNFAIGSRSMEHDLGFSGFLDRMNGNEGAMDNKDCRKHKRNLKQEKFLDFQIMSSAVNTNHEREIPLSSSGSLNLSNRGQSDSDSQSRDSCVHVQYVPTLKASVYSIVNEDFYDFFQTSEKNMPVTQDFTHMDTEDSLDFASV